MSMTTAITAPVASVDMPSTENHDMYMYMCMLYMFMYLAVGSCTHVIYLDGRTRPGRRL